MTDVSIVIVNWNAGKLLNECVESILKYGVENVNEIVIIDNFSSDDSISSLKIKPKIKPKIKLIENTENLGFAKACNIGFKSSKSEFVLLLNPDTQIKKDTLLLCTKFLSERPDVDILGCRHVDEEGKTRVSCARFPTVKSFFNDILGLSKVFPKFFHPATLMTDWDHSTSREVDQVIGAFMFMKRSIFERYGFFDERFFVYYEELDYCLRTKKAGGKVFYNADITIYHKGCGTTSNFKAFALFLSLRSRLKYIKKHFSYIEFLLISTATLTLEFLWRSGLAFFKGGVQGLKETFKGYKMLIDNKLKG